MLFRSATMQMAPVHQRGLALGAWGAVQATAAGFAIGLGGIIRDIVVALGDASWIPKGLISPTSGYFLVYCLEIVLLIATILSMIKLIYKKV